MKEQLKVRQNVNKKRQFVNNITLKPHRGKNAVVRERTSVNKERSSSLQRRATNTLKSDESILPKRAVKSLGRQFNFCFFH